MFGNPAELRSFIELTEGLYSLHMAATEHKEAERQAATATTRELTERQRSQDALRESEERFRAFVNATADVIYRMSADWSEMLYLQGKDFIADTEDPSRGWLDKYIHPDDQVRVLAAIRDAIRRKGIFELEHRVLRVDGTLGWTFSRAIPILDGNGEISEWFGAAADITERKQAEEALRQSERRFLQLAETIPQLAWMANADGWIFWYNQRWYQYTGTMPQQMEGWGWQSVHDPDVLQRVVQQWRTSIATGQPFDMTFPLRGADGIFRPFLTRVMPFKDAQGRVLLWFGTNTDISEQKRSEEEIRKLNAELLQLNAQLEQRVQRRTQELEKANDALRASSEELQRKNVQLDQFASIASHDLQEPLRTVTRFTQLLEKRYKGQLDADADRYIGFIVDAANRMQRLITDVLSYSRLGAASPRTHDVDCSAVVQRVIRSLHDMIHDSSAEIIYGQLPVVRGDATGLQQLFQNLIENAVKYRAAHRPRIEINAEANGNEWVFTIADNGIGIAPEYHESIFRVFQRLHTREQYPGTGIGLAICQRVIETHGGRIWLESTPGVGSKFYFTVPK